MSVCSSICPTADEYYQPTPDGTADVLIWLVAEVTSTIMAACIPFYRPLVRRVAGSSRKGGALRPSQESYGLAARSHSKGHNKLGSRAEVKGGFQEALPSDDSSDRAIVAGANGLDYEPASQIMRHTNIRVEYDEAPEHQQPHPRAGTGGAAGTITGVDTGKRASPSYYWGNNAR